MGWNVVPLVLVVVLLGTFSFFEFSNVGPALFLCMANIKTLCEMVRFSKSSIFSEFFRFSELLSFSDLFQRSLVLPNFPFPSILLNAQEYF